MHFIRIIQAAKNNRNKRLINKPSKKLPKSNRNNKQIIKNKPSKTLTKKPNKSITIKNKGIYPLQDVSLPVFQDLLEQGYDTATFVAHSNACAYCKKRNGKTWKLYQFISNLQYDAPIFEKAAHVNAQSQIKVSDSKGELEDVYVNYAGEISYTS